LPYIKALINENEFYKAENEIYKTDHPPGHFYSPIVSVEEVRKKEKEIFEITTNKIEGIDLKEEQQITLLKELAQNYGSLPFSDEKQNDLRYYYNNIYYGYSDAIFLHLVIRHFKPKSIIEVGSGFSSSVMMDTNELFFNNSINITFIEPYTERLLSLFKSQDNHRYKILNSDLQDVDLETFDNLNENDILFIDSTHVSKTNSDVNRILFKILPRLKRGVLIHFHDVFYPFEYLKEWVMKWKGFGWNEDYILRAFLMYNTKFEIIMFNTFLEHFHEDWFKENMPLCLKNKGGSIWLRKL
jgi:predicted O-methyltransferase YrrM